MKKSCGQKINPKKINFLSKILNKLEASINLFENNIMYAMWQQNITGGTFQTRQLRSTDGVTWTARNLLTSATWSSLTYGNGTFVAVSLNSTTAASIVALTANVPGSLIVKPVSNSKLCVPALKNFNTAILSAVE